MTQTTTLTPTPMTTLDGQSMIVRLLVDKLNEPKSRLIETIALLA